MKVEAASTNISRDGNGIQGHYMVPNSSDGAAKIL